MAIHGQKGSVYRKVAATTYVKILETTGWTLNITQQTAEAAVQEEEYVTRAAGAKDWNASIEGLAQTVLGNQNLVPLMVPASTSVVAAGSLFLRLRNNAGTAPVYQGLGVFTDMSVSSAEGSLVTMSATIAGVGILTYAAP